MKLGAALWIALHLAAIVFFAAMMIRTIIRRDK
jgi:hypothetical protein